MQESHSLTVVEMVRATALLSHAITLAPVVALVPLKVALPFQAAAPSNGMNTQAPLLAPRAALKVRVNDPAAPGSPVPVVRTTAPTESVLPAPMAQDGEVPPPEVKVQVGAEPPVTTPRLKLKVLLAMVRPPLAVRRPEKVPLAMAAVPVKIGLRIEQPWV